MNVLSFCYSCICKRAGEHNVWALRMAEKQYEWNKECKIHTMCGPGVLERPETDGCIIMVHLLRWR